MGVRGLAAWAVTALVAGAALAGCELDNTASNQAARSEGEIEEYETSFQAFDGRTVVWELEEADCPKPEMEDGHVMDCTAVYVVDGESLGEGPVEAELRDCHQGAGDESQEECATSYRVLGKVRESKRGFDLVTAEGEKKQAQ